MKGVRRAVRAQSNGGQQSPAKHAEINELSVKPKIMATLARANRIYYRADPNTDRWHNEFGRDPEFMR